MKDHKATHALIAEHVRHILQIMGFTAHVECGSVKQGEVECIKITVKVVENGNLLIGNGGSSLQALEHLMRCVVRRKIATIDRLTLDINNYLAQREKNLIQLAEDIAKEASKTGHPIALRPMSPSDRRTIHTALATHTSVRTESLGEEPHRRVLVKPVFLA